MIQHLIDIELKNINTVYFHTSIPLIVSGAFKIDMKSMY